MRSWMRLSAGVLIVLASAVPANDLLDRLPNNALVVFTIRDFPRLRQQILDLDQKYGGVVIPGLGPLKEAVNGPANAGKPPLHVAFCLRTLNAAGTFLLLQFETPEDALAEANASGEPADQPNLFRIKTGGFALVDGPYFLAQYGVDNSAGVLSFPKFQKSLRATLSEEVTAAHDAADVFYWTAAPKVRPIAAIAIGGGISAVETQLKQDEENQRPGYKEGQRGALEAFKGLRALVAETKEFYGGLKLVEGGVKLSVRIGLEPGKFFEQSIKPSTKSIETLLANLPSGRAAVLAAVDNQSLGQLVNDTIAMVFKVVASPKEGEAQPIDATVPASVLETIKKIEQFGISAGRWPMLGTVVAAVIKSQDPPQLFKTWEEILAEFKKRIPDDATNGLDEIQSVEEEGRRVVQVTSKDKTATLFGIQRSDGILAGMAQGAAGYTSLEKSANEEIPGRTHSLAHLPPLASFVVVADLHRLMHWIEKFSVPIDQVSEPAVKSESATIALSVGSRDGGMDVSAFVPFSLLDFFDKAGASQDDVPPTF